MQDRRGAFLAPQLHEARAGQAITHLPRTDPRPPGSPLRGANPKAHTTYSGDNVTRCQDPPGPVASGRRDPNPRATGRNLRAAPVHVPPLHPPERAPSPGPVRMEHPRRLGLVTNPSSRRGRLAQRDQWRIDPCFRRSLALLGWVSSVLFRPGTGARSSMRVENSNASFRSVGYRPATSSRPNPTGSGYPC